MKSIILAVFAGISFSASAIKPEREYRFTPTMRGLEYQEYQLTTPDKYSINVWEYSLPASVSTNRTIVIVGTDAGNMGYFIWSAKAFVEKGIRVISFDYRGFGKSSDFAMQQDYLYYPEFAVDLDSVIKATRKKYPLDKIGLYAISMGTYVSLLSKERTDFLVGEGFYHDPGKVAERIRANKDKAVILPDKTRAIHKLMGRKPVLLFCADADETTTTEDATQFAQRNNVEIIRFSGGHLEGLSRFTRVSPGDIYAAKVIEFLERNKL